MTNPCDTGICDPSRCHDKECATGGDDPNSPNKSEITRYIKVETKQKEIANETEENH